jgi:hypothetical protein
MQFFFYRCFAEIGFINQDDKSVKTIIGVLITIFDISQRNCLVNNFIKPNRGYRDQKSKTNPESGFPLVHLPEVDVSLEGCSKIGGMPLRKTQHAAGEHAHH